jgi:hypothetical protein
VGEEGRQAGVVVAGGVGVVKEELLGGAKLRLGLRESENGWMSPAPGRCSWQQVTRRWASALGAFSWRKLLRTWSARCSEVVHLGGGLQGLVSAAVARGGFEVGLRWWQRQVRR